MRLGVFERARERLVVVGRRRPRLREPLVGGVVVLALAGRLGRRAVGADKSCGGLIGPRGAVGADKSEARVRALRPQRTRQLERVALRARAPRLAARGRRARRGRAVLRRREPRDGSSRRAAATSISRWATPRPSPRAADGAGAGAARAPAGRARGGVLRGRCVAPREERGELRAVDLRQHRAGSTRGALARSPPPPPPPRARRRGSARARASRRRAARPRPRSAAARACTAARGRSAPSGCRDLDHVRVVAPREPRGRGARAVPGAASDSAARVPTERRRAARACSASEPSPNGRRPSVPSYAASRRRRGASSPRAPPPRPRRAARAPPPPTRPCGRPASRATRRARARRRARAARRGRARRTRTGARGRPRAGCLRARRRGPQLHPRRRARGRVQVADVAVVHAHEVQRAHAREAGRERRGRAERGGLGRAQLPDLRRHERAQLGGAPLARAAAALSSAAEPAAGAAASRSATHRARHRSTASSAPGGASPPG